MVKVKKRKDSLLQLISDIGSEGRHRDFCRKIRDYWPLTEEEKDNEGKLFHHVASIEQALKTAKFVELKGGIWKITETGKKHLSSLGPNRGLKQTENNPVIGDLPLCKDLREAQRDSNNPTVFEKALVKAFKELGFDAEHIGGRDEPDIFVNDRFKIIIDSKTTKEGVITERYINFDAMDRYKENEKYKARFLCVIAAGFSEGYIRETAKKRGIFLIETEAICQLLQNHKIYPYEQNRIVKILFESGKYIITQGDVPPSTFDQEKFIEIVAKILSDIKLTRKNNFSSRDLRNAYSWQALNYESDDIEKALNFLSTVPFNILQKQNDEYSLTSDIESILKKIGLLLEAFHKIG